MNYTTKDIENIAKNGRNVKITYQSDKGNGIIKVTTGVYRLGVNYSHIKSVIAKNGGKVNPLPYGKWLIENLIIDNNGKYQVRITQASMDFKPSSKYLLNGKETSKDSLIQSGLLKDKPHTASNVFNVKLENIIQIG